MSLGVRTVPWIHEVDGRWVERDVYSRVEFVVDGQDLSELTEQTAGDQGMVTLFELASVDAVSVLAGNAAGEWMSGTSRIPLLVCGCGDPHCWALTVQLSRDASSVTWSDWAWEDHLGPPVALRIPAHVFAATDYERVLGESKRLALANAVPKTRMRVRVPGPWWRNVVKPPNERTDAAAMRGWLRAEPVLTDVEEPHDGYRDVLDQLAVAQRLLAAADHKTNDLALPQQSKMLRALTTISESSDHVALPSYTLDSVRWHLDRAAEA